jgi:hypothetical protein
VESERVDYNFWGFSSSICWRVLGGSWILNVSRRFTFSGNSILHVDSHQDTIYPTKREADKTSLSGGSKILKMCF